ncbi:iron complex transport system ATP-binding protein [Stackebrandtia albiflava]|uniref:Iron complex transport system ATP-binding protein n=1 Tax=Stackebrandtia albiflava TaxID=406432 RepID=A0A562V1U8_9ACTN|nr:ABC transporter ATP-binding protein [Stackebrandtia albiflava]TWJ11777.1 iron complex transport system ATP-binding protein [Stackebrandtia albiflava]
MTALTAAGVRVALGGVPVVRDVSFSVGDGEWLTVIGPNGAGKSTLLHAVAGLLPFTGDVRWHGDDPAGLHRRQRSRRVAVVPQHPVVPTGMSVFDYILLGRTPHLPFLGRESPADLSVVAAVCERLDLTGLAGRRLDTLSGGERQRVFLARALAQLSGAGRALLLLDEPTSALDIGHQQEVLELVDSLRRDGGLTVVSTMHELSVAGEYADRLLLLAAGEVVAAGPPAEVLTVPLLTRHYRANVMVVDTSAGPAVVPVRPGR